MCHKECDVLPVATLGSMLCLALPSLSFNNRSYPDCLTEIRINC